MVSRLPIRIAFCVLWLVAAGVGLAVMLNYQNAAGRTGQTPALWPSEAEITLERERATLVMFAHPRCPCTRASIGELNRLLAHCGGRVAAHVLFFQPGGVSDNWTKTDLWRSATAIPDVVVHADRQGSQARRFGAETSGLVVLYSARGELLFKGGITAARGHAGDNAGAKLVVSLLLAGEDTSVRQTPVYGCSLVNECGNSAEETGLCVK